MGRMDLFQLAGYWLTLREVREELKQGLQTEPTGDCCLAGRVNKLSYTA